MPSPTNFETWYVPLIDQATNRLDAFAQHFCRLFQSDWWFEIDWDGGVHFLAFFLPRGVFFAEVVVLDGSD